MFGKLLSLFILTSFLFSFLAESKGVHNFSNYNESQILNGSSVSALSVLISADCEDCQENDCSDHSSHCSHHCSGLHNIAPTKNQLSLQGPTSKNSKVLWYYNHHYKTPFLDPALKPPLYS